MKPIDADELLKRTIYNPFHAPYIVEKDIREMPPAEPKRKRYRHFKGGIYEVICEAAHHTESLESLVIYKNVKTGEIWARPDWMFYGNIRPGKKRFEEVSE